MSTLFKSFRNSIGLFMIVFSIPAHSFEQPSPVLQTSPPTKADSLQMMQAKAALELAKKRSLQGGKNTPVGASGVAGPVAMADAKGQMTNSPAPEFSLYDTKGKLVTLQSLKGKVIVLDFWATWCTPCLASFPAMQRVVTKYKADKDVVFLFVNTLERNKDVQSWIAGFKKEHPYSFRILLDKENRVNAAYDVAGLPAKVIIDKSGIIRFTSMGFGGDSSLEKELVSMIESTKNARHEK